MKLLLDTHVLIWSYMDPTQLSSAARQCLTDVNNDLFVSHASLWEIAIKVGKGHFQLNESIQQFAVNAVLANGFSFLPIEIAHIAVVAKLPRQNHGDPFDRLLVVQAITESATLISADAVLDQYGVQRLW